jgi:hypothetical protein
MTPINPGNGDQRLIMNILQTRKPTPNNPEHNSHYSSVVLLPIPLSPPPLQFGAVLETKGGFNYYDWVQDNTVEPSPCHIKRQHIVKVKGRGSQGNYYRIVHSIRRRANGTGNLSFQLMSLDRAASGRIELKQLHDIITSHPPTAPTSDELTRYQSLINPITIPSTPQHTPSVVIQSPPSPLLLPARKRTQATPFQYPPSKPTTPATPKKKTGRKLALKKSTPSPKVADDDDDTDAEIEEVKQPKKKKKSATTSPTPTPIPIPSAAPTPITPPSSSSSSSSRALNPSTKPKVAKKGTLQPLPMPTPKKIHRSQDPPIAQDNSQDNSTVHDNDHSSSFPLIPIAAADSPPPLSHDSNNMSNPMMRMHPMPMSMQSHFFHSPSYDSSSLVISHMNHMRSIQQRHELDNQNNSFLHGFMHAQQQTIHQLKQQLLFAYKK